MKKTFLVFGIAAFSSASAQQKDLFDINKHLQKITAEKNFPAYNSNSNAVTVLTGKDFLQLPQQSYYLLPNGDKFRTLSGDNMPCIIPGKRYTHFTPNPALATSPGLLLHPKDLPGAIPNSGFPKF